MLIFEHSLPIREFTLDGIPYAVAQTPKFCSGGTPYREGMFLAPCMAGILKVENHEKFMFYSI